MAINKSIEHATGEILNHHVINLVSANNRRGTFELVFESFGNAQRYNDGKPATASKIYNLPIRDLPLNVKQALGALKDAIQAEAINLPHFSGGIIVSDDGN